MFPTNAVQPARSCEDSSPITPIGQEDIGHDVITLDGRKRIVGVNPWISSDTYNAYLSKCILIHLENIIIFYDIIILPWHVLITIPKGNPGVRSPLVVEQSHGVLLALRKTYILVLTKKWILTIIPKRKRDLDIDTKPTAMYLVLVSGILSGSS